MANVRLKQIVKLPSRRKQEELLSRSVIGGAWDCSVNDEFAISCTRTIYAHFLRHEDDIDILPYMQKC